MSDNQPSKFLSFVACKCPRCRTGRVFPESALSFGFHKTNENCPKCGLKFEHETGFFWAAMYVSYAFSVAIMIVVGALANSYDWPINRTIYILIPVILFLTPFLYRYSRIALLYFISPNRSFDVRYRKGELKDSGNI